MRIAIVGASGAGLYAAIFLKRKHPDFKVEVFDHADKVGKKLLATGNGHCNLLNTKMAGRYYNDPQFIDSLLERYPLSTLQESLAELGIATLEKGDLVYPLSYSAASHVKYLNDLATSLGVAISLGVDVKDYEVGNGVKLLTTKGPKDFDKVIFATGGASQPNLGSDASIFHVLERHGYDIKPLVPSLCPLKTKEKTKMISGLRHEAKITLIKNGKTLYEEVGEILFKDDGLSGIAIFNASAFLARGNAQKAEVQVDLFPNLSQAQLQEYLDQAKKVNNNNPNNAIIDEKLAKYASFAGKMQGIEDFSKILKSLRFHVEGLYPFASSQVSSGGLKIKEITPDFAAKKEDNVYFVGEMLDIDGICGGFNLGFALLSAYVCAANL